jgi:hypothetical protein
MEVARLAAGLLRGFASEIMPLTTMLRMDR